MPDRVKEKLVELQDESDICPEGITSCFDCQYYIPTTFGKPCDVRKAIADKMIANGVTVQEWISVKERLPNGKKVIDGEEYIKNVAVRIKDDAPEKIAFYDDEEKCWFDTEFFPIAGEVTHWCELPQPAKGE